MTLNGVMAVTLRYFTEFGKPALQKTMCGGIYARDLYCVGGTLSLTQSIYCIFSECTMSSQRKFTFAISSPDEFLVIEMRSRKFSQTKQECSVICCKSQFIQKNVSLREFSVVSNYTTFITKFTVSRDL